MKEIKRKQIDAIDYASDILKGVKNGALLTTKSGEKVNTMSIAWGQLGIEWNKVIFTAFVRTGRYTHSILENSDEFTVNISVDKKAGKIISFCGTKTGNDVDKIKELGLTLIDSVEVDVPGIAELPLTLECKVIHKQLQNVIDIPEKLQTRFYPEEVESTFPGSNRDYHTMFFAEVVSAYIVEK